MLCHFLFYFETLFWSSFRSLPLVSCFLDYLHHVCFLPVCQFKNGVSSCSTSVCLPPETVSVLNLFFSLNLPPPASAPVPCDWVLLAKGDRYNQRADCLILQSLTQSSDVWTQPRPLPDPPGRKPSGVWMASSQSALSSKTIYHLTHGRYRFDHSAHWVSNINSFMLLSKEFLWRETKTDK